MICSRYETNVWGPGRVDVSFALIRDEGARMARLPDIKSAVGTIHKAKSLLRAGFPLTLPYFVTSFQRS